MSVAKSLFLLPHGEKYQSVSRRFQESRRYTLGEKDSFTPIVYIFYIHPPMNTQHRYLEYMYTSRSSLMFVGNGNADSHKWERTQSKGLTSSRQTLLKAFRFRLLSPIYHHHPFLLALLSHGNCAALKAHNSMSLAEYNILEVFDRRYQSVLNQFLVSWRHYDKQPPSRIIRIVKIQPPYYVHEKYYEYRYFLELRGDFSQWGMSEGNECRRWHGTRHDHQRCSLLGDYVFKSGYCEDDGCNICNIASTGFILPTHTNRMQRFGAGIYLSSTSSKSDDYTGRVGGSPKPKPGRKAIFLCEVALGYGAELSAGDWQLFGPPDGYDSVIGTPGICRNLNYDEVVVYNQGAVLPAYLVVYE